MEEADLGLGDEQEHEDGHGDGGEQNVKCHGLRERRKGKLTGVNADNTLTKCLTFCKTGGKANAQPDWGREWSPPLLRLGLAAVGEKQN